MQIPVKDNPNWVKDTKSKAVLLKRPEDPNKIELAAIKDRISKIENTFIQLKEQVNRLKEITKEILDIMKTINND